MSVTNEEVNGPNSIGGGGGTSTPTLVTIASSVSTGPASIPSVAAGTSVSDDVVKSGYLRKLKGRKKFFVLRKETEAGKPARLEYYANERRFRNGQPPKRSIVLKACFNISRTESKCKYSIALHTHNDCVRIAMSTEDEMNDWLRVMNSLAGDEEVEDNDVSTQTKPHFEHIWLVTALNKGLGSKENILGPYRLCLTSKELTLLKVGAHDHNNSVVKFPLNVIRAVSHDATFGCFFHIEFGRLAATGPGQLSLKTEDNNIAQNMHLLILNAMQNYKKDDTIVRDNGQRRPRVYTWNSESESARSNSFHNTPPGLNRYNSMDSSSRPRTESMSSSERRAAGMSPPMQILISNPSIAFNSPMCSTGTDSASSSYSMELENNLNNNNSNNGSGLGRRSLLLSGSDNIYSKSCEEDESYVPYYPGDEQQPSSLRLPLHPDSSDYVDTSIISKESGSAAQTPSSYMEVQSPMSPFDNYIPMSPAAGIMTGTSIKSSGKLSVSHSRNSSLIEENEGYVPMIPGSIHSRSESGACSTAGSTTGLDEQYLEMDFARKLEFSNDEMQSSESIQSGTPSSEYNLDKVSSYLSDDMEGGRPARAYSVGSKSDTSSTGKGRSGKMRLEAVPESRMRSCSMGANSKPVRPILPSGRHCPTLSSVAVSGMSKSGIPGTPLSSSWSGSGSRMPPYKYPSVYNTHFQTQNSHASTASESADSDLMELDFSHNKKGRKRSLPGPGGNLSSSSNSGSSNITKLSPVPKALNISGGETPPVVEPLEIVSKSSVSGNGGNSSSNSRYPASEPISIQKCNKVGDGGVGYPDSGVSILTRMTGMDLNKLKELDASGAYLDMDFSGSNSSSNNISKTTDKLYSAGTFPRKSSTSNLPTSNSFFNNILDSVKSIAGSPSSNSNNSPVVVVRAHDPLVTPRKALSFLSSNTNTSSSNNTNTSSPIAVTEPQPLSRSLSSSSNISTTSNNSNSSSTSCVSVKSQYLHSLQCQPQQGQPQPPAMSPTAETSHFIANSSQHSTAPTNSLPLSLPMTRNSDAPGVTTPSTTTTTITSSATTTTVPPGLSRIEESPEKQDPLRLHLYTPIQSPPPSPSIISPDGDHQVTYATIQHLPQARRSLHFSGGTGCGTTAASIGTTVKGAAITYAQIDFVKSPEVNVQNN